MIVSEYFAWILDVLSLLPVGLILGLVVVQSVRVLCPGGNVDFDAELDHEYKVPLEGGLCGRLILFLELLKLL